MSEKMGRFKFDPHCMSFERTHRLNCAINRIGPDSLGYNLYFVFGPGNGSPSATNVVVVGDVVIRF